MNTLMGGLGPQRLASHESACSRRATPSNCHVVPKHWRARGARRGPQPCPVNIGSHVPLTKEVPYYYRDARPWPTAEELPYKKHDLQAHPAVDLVVAGAGPAGVAVAERVAREGFKVCVVDPAPLGAWPNNYGVWVDEFQAMGLEDCLEIIWPKAKVWLRNTAEGEKRLARPYGRVDRPALKAKLMSRCIAHGVTFLEAKVEGVTHGGGASTVALSSGRSICGSLVLDATGHSRRLVQYDKAFDPGYQGAYGIIAEVESHPFDTDTMLFMDWRDDHLADDPAMRARNEKLPTFLYAMPYSKNKIFLEETSLVARPAVDFPEIKARLEKRLKWLGVQVKRVEEEEYCLIPMGGVLPKHPQRVLAIGGTAGQVHPSTGFMVSRMLGSVPTVADAIVDQLSSPADRASAAGTPKRPQSEEEAEEMAAAVWRMLWPLERLRQRAFFTFGMDVLLKLNLSQTRNFFNAFFDLSAFHWHGFLSTRLTLPQLITFGLSLFVKSDNKAKLTLLMKGLPGLVGLIGDVLPTYQDYYGLEAKKMKMKNAVEAAAAPAPPAPVATAQAEAAEAPAAPAAAKSKETETVPAGAGRP